MTKENASAYVGGVSYIAPLPHVSWDAFDVAIGGNPVTRVTVDTNEQGTSLQIHIYFAGVKTWEQARPITDALADKLARRLGYQLNTDLRTLTCIGGEITETQPDGTTALSSSYSAVLSISASCTDWYKLGPGQVSEIQQHVSQSVLPGEKQYDLYCSLMAVKDTVAKFLSLYQVLMLFHGDVQADVDKFILRHEPTAEYELTDPPRHKKPNWTKETVYARLRNQIGHNRQKKNQTGNWTLQETEAEMGTHMAGLMMLVKQCLKENG